MFQALDQKGALAIMASGEPAQIIQAIEEENEKYLTKFPGIGWKKTARQIILDLKGNGKVLAVLLPLVHLSPRHKMGHWKKRCLLLSALGYSEREIKKIAPKLQR